MATRSYIGIEYADQIVHQVYCHYDGGLTWNGIVLFKYYNTLEKVEDLIKHGSLSTIGRFPYSVEGVKASWGRGIAYSICKPHALVGNDIDPIHVNVFPNVLCENYSYIFRVSTGEWIVRSGRSKEWVLLEDALREDESAQEVLEEILDAEIEEERERRHNTGDILKRVQQ